MAMARITNPILIDQRRPAKPTTGDIAFTRYGLTDGIWATMVTCWDSNPHLRPDVHDVSHILDHVADVE
jgi:hypothetical protein